MRRLPPRMLLCLVAGALLAPGARAQAWEVGSRVAPFTLEDQHGESRAVDASVALVLFSRDMDGGDVLEKALEGRDAAYLAARGAVYVADISRMPRIVTRLFALPRLRKRPYPMLLDRDGEVTRRLPGAEGRATLIHLEALRVTRIEHFDSPEALRAALDAAGPGS